MAFKFNWINDFKFNIARRVSSSFQTFTPEGSDGLVGTTFKTLSSIAGNFPWSDTPEMITVESGSALDTVAGTGMQQIFLSYIDANGLSVDAVVDMDGAGVVNVASGLMVNRTSGCRGGSLQRNQGLILIKRGASIIGQIRPANAPEEADGGIQQAVHQVALNRAGYVFGGWRSTGSSDSGRILAFTRIPGGIWVKSKDQSVFESAARFGEAQLPFLKVPPGTQIELRCVNAVGAPIFCSGGFSLHWGPK